MLSYLSNQYLEELKLDLTNYKFNGELANGLKQIENNEKKEDEDEKKMVNFLGNSKIDENQKTQINLETSTLIQNQKTQNIIEGDE